MIKKVPYSIPALAQALPVGLDKVTGTALRALTQALDQGFKLIAQIINGNDQYYILPGQITSFGMIPPAGVYLKCDGASYPTSQYPDLFAAIGYSSGGSGANFNVPNDPGFWIKT